MNIPLRRSIAALHQSSGAFFGSLLFIILFTGCWSLGSDNLKLWWNQIPIGEPLLPLSSLLALNDSAQVVRLPKAALPVITFCQQFGVCNESYSAITGLPVSMSSPTDALVTLHKNLFIDFPGRLLISFFGFALAILLISGFILNRQKIASLFRLRWRQGWRLFLSDLHNCLGLWCYPWLILFALTGAMSGLGALGTLSLAPIVSPDNPQLVMQQLMAGFQPVPAEVAKLQPNLVDFLTLAQAHFIPEVLFNQAGSVTVGGVHFGLLGTENFEQYQFQLPEGQLLAVRSSAQQGFWTRAFIAIQPLHYGQYQWLPSIAGLMGIMHFIAGFSACLLTATGLAIWSWKRPDALISRVFVGVCGGLVAAAALLLLSALIPDQASTRLFFSLWGLCIVLVLFNPSVHLSLIVICLISAVALLIAAIHHLISHLSINDLWLISNVDFTLIFSGLFLLFVACMMWKYKR